MDNNVIKIHVMGEGGVGKSAVTMCLIRSRFVEEYDPTIGSPHPPCLLIKTKISPLLTCGQKIHIQRLGQLTDGHLRLKSLVTLPRLRIIEDRTANSVICRHGRPRGIPWSLAVFQFTKSRCLPPGLRHHLSTLPRTTRLLR